MMLKGRALAWVPVGWGWGCDTLGWPHPQGWLFFKELLVRRLLPCCLGEEAPSSVQDPHTTAGSSPTLLFTSPSNKAYGLGCSLDIRQSSLTSQLPNLRSLRMQ